LHWDFRNAGTLVVVPVSADDAHVLEPEFEPDLAAGALTRLGRHEIALKLCSAKRRTRYQEACRQ